eukprot:GILJ01011742.1.p1 GENE.GILJ01011742.1~~GILJ01011742.1.p1  ORF type:complete len:890 (-),score=91.12 GILJ01011742.1:105-2774(-)
MQVCSSSRVELFGNTVSCLALHSKFVVVQHRNGLTLLVPYEFDIRENKFTYTGNQITLEGHGRAVTVIAVSPSYMDDIYCVTASRDCALLWNLSSSAQNWASNPPSSVQIDALDFDPESAAFDATGRFFAVAVHAAIRVYRCPSGAILAVLEGHQAPITSLCFHFQKPNLVLSIADDRSIRVWDLGLKECITSHRFVSASTPLSITTDPFLNRITIGHADGRIHFFELTENNKITEVYTFQLKGSAESESFGLDAEVEGRGSPTQEGMSNASMLPAKWKPPAVGLPPKPTANGRQRPPSVKRSDSERRGRERERALSVPAETPAVPQSQVTIQPAVIGLYYWASSVPTSSSIISEEREALCRLIAVTPSSVQCFNPYNYQQVSFIDFTRNEENIPPNTGAVAFVRGEQQGVFALASAFDSFAGLLGVQFSTSVPCEDQEGQMEVSVFPSHPALSNSPLFVKEKVEEKSKSKVRSQSLPRKSKGIVQNLPVTFHSKVKSSGYGAPPVMKLFGSKGNAKKATAPKRAGLSAHLRQYPVTGGPPVDFQMEHVLPSDPPLMSGPITRVRYSGDGTITACASVDNTLRILKLPLSKNGGEGADLIGHTQSVVSFSFSHDSNYLISASNDQTARLWHTRGPKAGDAPLIFSNLLHSSPDKNQNNLLGREVRHAQFFYLDQFVLLAVGPDVLLYRYKLMNQENEDVKRFQMPGSYRLLQRYTHPNAHYLTHLSAPNSFLSHIAIASASNKEMAVWDIGVNKCVRLFEDGHARPVSTVRLFGSSTAADTPASYCNLFLTSAPDNTIKLWDLRDQKCARVFAGHTNRVQSVGSDISPCGRYVASGSETQCCVLFDLRTGGILASPSQHSDVVTDVAFHPLLPQLCSVSFDRKIRFYRS